MSMGVREFRARVSREDCGGRYRAAGTILPDKSYKKRELGKNNAQDFT